MTIVNKSRQSIAILILFLCIMVTFKINAQQLQYKFDSQNRLIETLYPDSINLNFSYDNDGNRISQSITKITPSTSVKKTDSISLNQPKLTIYPNPSSGNFSGDILSIENQEIEIEIFDITGKSVYKLKQTISVGYFHFDINIFSLSPGTYILNCRSKNMNESEKVIIAY